MNKFLELFFASGFFQSKEVINALWIGSIVAAISGIIGVFIIIRGQSFVGHAVSDFGGAGGAIAFLMGINTFWGFLGFGVAAAACIEFLGNKVRERDLATGIVLSVALGVEVLFLYLDSNSSGKANAPMIILFGSVFLVNPSNISIVIIITIVIAIILCIIYRQLLICSVDTELAYTRGIHVRAISLIFIILLSLVVEESSLIIGSLLSTALLIGPAAVAIRLTHKIGFAMLWSSILGILSMWIGISLSYNSFHWPPSGRGWPVSFFVSLSVLIFYFIVRLFNQLLETRIIGHRRVMHND